MFFLINGHSFKQFYNYSFRNLLFYENFLHFLLPYRKSPFPLKMPILKVVPHIFRKYLNRQMIIPFKMTRLLGKIFEITK